MHMRMRHPQHDRQQQHKQRQQLQRQGSRSRSKSRSRSRSRSKSKLLQQHLQVATDQEQRMQPLSSLSQTELKLVPNRHLAGAAAVGDTMKKLENKYRNCYNLIYGCVNHHTNQLKQIWTISTLKIGFKRGHFFGWRLWPNLHKYLERFLCFRVPCTEYRFEAFVYCC